MGKYIFIIIVFQQNKIIMERHGDQRWEQSYINPKHKETKKELYNNALSNNAVAMNKVVSNKANKGINHDAKKYAEAIESEDMGVQSVGHDIKIAIQKGRQAKSWNQKQLAEAIMVKPDII